MKKVSVELEVVGVSGTKLIEVTSLDELHAAGAARLGGEVRLFERDQDDELASLEGRTAISVIAHRCLRIEVTVGYEHLSKSQHFRPGATVNRVLEWATGRRGFDLDDDAQAKANLILPGADQPLPPEAPIGRFVTAGTCNVTAELTLKDFTNGRA